MLKLLAVEVLPEEEEEEEERNTKKTIPCRRKRQGKYSVFWSKFCGVTVQFNTGDTVGHKMMPGGATPFKFWVPAFAEKNILGTKKEN